MRVEAHGVVRSSEEMERDESGKVKVDPAPTCTACHSSPVTDLVLLCDAFVGETTTFPVRQFGDKDADTGLHGTSVGEFGRPYMYFATDSAVWIVGMGPDRIYQGGKLSSVDELVYLVE